MATINITIDDVKLTNYSNACQWNEPSLVGQGFTDQQIVKKWLKDALQANNLAYKEAIYIPADDGGIG